MKVKAIASDAKRQRGFSLIELSIAILIGLFLMGGLVTLVGGMKRTNGNQTGLSQLQDNERMSMSLITDVIQTAGYFPSPTVNTSALMFPVIGSFTAPGQSIFGTGAYTAAAPGDSISVRYATGGGDGVINCAGNTSAVAATYINTFSVVGGNLICQLVTNGGAPQTVQLVSGVTNLAIYYGVQTNVAAGNNSVDAYLDGAAVAAGNYWNNVISVQITLTFLNPLSQPGQTPLTPIPFQRTIVVMNKAGVIT
jgi:type IV pilus assembly protein PilW